MTITLRDGSRIAIRPVEPDDRQALAKKGFERLSAESRYRRFVAPMPELSDRYLDYLARVDHHDHEALVAVDPTKGDGVRAGMRGDPPTERAALTRCVESVLYSGGLRVPRRPAPRYRNDRGVCPVEDRSDQRGRDRRRPLPGAVVPTPLECDEVDERIDP